MRPRDHIPSIIILALLTVFLSLPALRYGYLLEDYKYLRSYSLSEVARTFVSHWEPTLEETKGYRPLHSVQYAFFHRLIGGGAVANHLLATALMVSGVLLLYLLALRCSGEIRPAFWAAFLYPCLGMNAWQISWLVNRQHLLQINFSLLALLFFDRHLRSRKAGPWLLAFLCFLLNLLLKEEAATLPLILGAYGLLITGSQFRRLLKGLLPFFLALAAFTVVRTAVVKDLPAFNHHPPPLPLAPGIVIREYGRAVLSTLVQTCGVHDPGNEDFPIYGGGLSRDRDYLAAGALAALILLGLGTGGAGRAVDRKTLAFGASVVLLGSLLVAVWYRNNRLYISSIGVALIGGVLMGGAFRSLEQAEGDLRRRMAAGAAAACFLAYLGLNLLSFFELQDALRPDGRLARIWDIWAYDEYAPWMKPEQTAILRNRILSRPDLAAPVEKTPRLAEELGKAGARLSGELARRDPARAGDPVYNQEALHLLSRAVILDPRAAEARNALGALLFRQGQLTGAIDQFTEAVRLRPDFAEARANLDRALGTTNYAN